MVLLPEILRGPQVEQGVLRCLHWFECQDLGSVSKGLFMQVRSWIEAFSADVSLGSSVKPIACDPDYRRVGCSTTRSRWCVGGRVPSSFKYLNKVIFPFGAQDTMNDLLEGCSCWGTCGVDGEGDECSCAILNAAAGSCVTPLFECHAGCSCTAACRLRPTQQGGGRILPRMKLRFTGRRGWGAYAVDFISRGSFVSEYTGEFLSLGEARRRVLGYDRVGANYVLAVREFFQGGTRVHQTIVDATSAGNASRFMNHSCEPNLSVFVVRRGTFLGHLCFFAQDDIDVGCELTYDYGATGAAGGGPVDDDGATGRAKKVSRRGMARTLPVEGSPGSDQRSGRVECLCGSRRCAGFLPRDRSMM